MVKYDVDIRLYQIAVNPAEFPAGVPWRFVMQIEIRFVRHGQANSAATDVERKLSDLGRAQAGGVGLGWDQSRFRPTVVVSSRAPRAVDTAQITTGLELSRIVQCEELYFGTNPEWLDVINGAYEKLGNAPLIAYDMLSIAVGDAIKHYAIAAVTAICTAIRECETPPTQVAVFGHAVLLPAVARHMLQTYGIDDGTVENVVMSECDVIKGVLTRLL